MNALEKLLEILQQRKEDHEDMQYACNEVENDESITRLGHFHYACSCEDAVLINIIHKMMTDR